MNSPPILPTGIVKLELAKLRFDAQKRIQLSELTKTKDQDGSRILEACGRYINDHGSKLARLFLLLETVMMRRKRKTSTSRGPLDLSLGSGQHNRKRIR